MELGSGAHTGTATNRPNSLLQLPSFSYVLVYLYHVNNHEKNLLIPLFCNHFNVCLNLYVVITVIIICYNLPSQISSYF